MRLLIIATIVTIGFTLASTSFAKSENEGAFRGQLDQVRQGKTADTSSSTRNLSSEKIEKSEQPVEKKEPAREQETERKRPFHAQGILELGN